MFCLMKTSLLESLVRFTTAASARSTAGPRSTAASRSFRRRAAFVNANTASELQQLQADG